MYREQILKHLMLVKLPKEGYCLFGGSCLAIRNLRPTDDIDMYVTKLVYDELKKDGWKEIKETGHMPYLMKEVSGVQFEAFITSDSNGWKPKIEEYINNPEIIEGFPFMPLTELYEWKDNVRRPKDVRDLKIIDEFWAKQKML